MKLTVKILSLLLLTAFAYAPSAYSARVEAPEDRASTTRLNIVHPTDTVSTNSYKKEGDSILINYNLRATSITDPDGNIIPITGGRGEISLTCEGENENGGWIVESSSGDGVCWKEQTFTRTTTINGHSIIEYYTLPAKNLTDDLDSIITPRSTCTGTAVLGNSGDIKRYCEYNSNGTAEINNKLTGRTGDDMFRLDARGKGYLEYLAVGGIDAPNRLTYFRRTSGENQPVMIPAGPAGTFADYDHFIRNTTVAETKKGCFIADIKLCGIAESAILDRVECTDPGLTWNATAETCEGATPPPQCGSAISTPRTDAPVGNLCTYGTPSAVSGDGPWNWNCSGTSGPTVACETPVQNTHATCPDGTLLPQGVVPNGQTCPPTDLCFFQTASFNIGRLSSPVGWIPEIAIGTEVLEDGMYNYYLSNIVGAGNYSKVSPIKDYNGHLDSYFSTSLRNVPEETQRKYPFYQTSVRLMDAMAIGPNTSVTIYSKENFNGTILFKAHGPKVINSGLVEAYAAVHIDWSDYDLNATPIDTYFPKETRIYSPPSADRNTIKNLYEENNIYMQLSKVFPSQQHELLRGTSVKVECEPPPQACPDGRVLPQGVVPNEQNCAPTEECFVQISGTYIGDENDLGPKLGIAKEFYGGGFTLIGDDTITMLGIEFDSDGDGDTSEYPWISPASAIVGPGEYAQLSPHYSYRETEDYGFSWRTPSREYPTSDQYDFYTTNTDFPEYRPEDMRYDPKDYPLVFPDSFSINGLAMGENTKITIYSEEDFQGDIVFEHEGALVMNNSDIRNRRETLFGTEYIDWINHTYPEPFQSMLPASARQWSTENMRAWGRGTSMKVECDGTSNVSVSQENAQLDFQTGTFIARATVKNIGTVPLTNARIFVRDIPSGFELWNKHGSENGVPFIEYRGEIQPDEEKEIILEYFSPTRGTLNTTGITVDGIGDITPIDNTVTPSGTIIPLIKSGTVLTSAISNGHRLIEFALQPGHTYNVQYSFDNSTWYTVTSQIFNNGATALQWIDRGQPYTSCALDDCTVRYYRVFEQSP